MFSSGWHMIYAKRRRPMALGLSFFLLGLCALFVESGSCAVASPGKEGVGFRWAFGALLANGDDRKLERMGEEMTLKTGDQFKMMVELESNCFVYVIYHNAKDGVKMLFPYDLDQFNTDYQIAKRYYIPQGDAWFELDQHVGSETFYVLASAKRLASIEDLFRQYESANAARRSELIKQILEEIQEIKKERHELVAPAERPVPIGGAIRGLEKVQGNNQPDVAALAESVSCSGSLARTYTIEHQ